MSRIYAKEIFSDMLNKEIEGHQKLLDDALLRIPAALQENKLSEKALEIYYKSQAMLNLSKGALKEESFDKTLRFLVHAVANYYLMLGDKGVLRNG